MTGSDPETIDPGTISSRYADVLTNKSLILGGKHVIHYDMDRDMLWRWDQVLKTHPNGMRFSVFGADGDLLATNEYFRLSDFCLLYTISSLIQFIIALAEDSWSMTRRKVRFLATFRRPVLTGC